MKNYAFAVLLIIITLCSFSSCHKERRTYVIGVSQCSQDIWREKLNKELELSTYSYEENVKLHIATAYDDDRRQIRQIDSLVEIGIDLLIVSPNQEGKITVAIERARDKQIPVILLDRKCDTDRYTAFIGSDNVAIGRVIGDYTAARLGGKGRVVEIKGLRASSPAEERHRGFVEALKKYPEIEIVATAEGNWLKESGRTAMEEILKARTDFDGVFGQNDRMALGAYEAVKSHGTERPMFFVGVDALAGKDNGLELVTKGVFAASYIYPTRGDLVVQLAMNILTGKPYQRENHLKATIVTQENAPAMLMQAEELAAQYERIKTLHRKVDFYLAQYSHQKIYLLLLIIIVLLVIASLSLIFRYYLMKQRIAEEQANAKLVFFTNVSHEFRTPLTLIADPIERLSKADNLLDEQRTTLSMVKKQVGLMLRLVNEILDLRRVQNKKMELTLSRFDIDEAMKTWTDGFAQAAESKGITFTLQSPAGSSSGETVIADCEKLGRIVYNLLSNALKYTEKGGRITVRYERTGTPETFRLTVADTGIGIPRQKAGRVFERFFQAHGEKADSAGIGLAIVKAFAELHGGKVGVESEPGKGSTFYVELPQNLPVAANSIVNVEENQYASWVDPHALTVEDSSARNNLSRITDNDYSEEKAVILVVDDNPDIRAYLTSLLKGDYRVEQAANGREGLEKAIRLVPNLIVSDVMMPVMDGQAMCRALKSDSITGHIPVLLLTARAADSQRAEAYDCGADAYLSKPFNSEVLLSRIRNLIEQRKNLYERFTAAVTSYPSVRQIEKEESAPVPSANRPAPTADERFIDSLRKLIQQNLANPELTVETLAEGMNMSRVQLYRKVKALTGASPVDLVRTSRLMRANDMLRRGECSVSEVAYRTGFNSPSYFSKCYKAYFGHSPSE